jgi:hypothetical protein
MHHFLPALLLSLFCLSTSPSWAQSEPLPPAEPEDTALVAPLEPPPEATHDPVMKTYVRLGYQIDLFGEKLTLPNTELGEITAGGVVYHEPRIGGMYRFKQGALKNAYVFMDYTFLSQPVKNQRTGDQFGRFTHFLDAGIGYFFPLMKDRIELAPYLGMSAQFNHNDKTIDDKSVYYHVNQNRLGFGLGTQLAVRFDDALPFPLFLFVNLAAYPFTPVLTDSTTASFPSNMSIFHLGFSWYGRFLPYLGAEAGFRQQFHLGSGGSADFSASWSEFFATVRFEPEILFP